MHLFPFADVDSQLLNQIHEAADRLARKLRHLEPRQLPISPYNQRYLGAHIRKLDRTLQKYSYLLFLALARSRVPPADAVLVDYGGGSGLLSMLAKATGVGRVIYCDIYDVSCVDARSIAVELNLAADAYVPGDIDDLFQYIADHHITATGMVSYDVLEHIYDVPKFFQTAGRFVDPGFHLVMGSGANRENPLVRLYLHMHHRRIETQSRETSWGHKPRDSPAAYRSARRDIIRQHAPDIDTRATEMLSRRTRGLMIDDIRRVVDEYRSTGRITYRPESLTDTCDPYTGNWTEHLLNLTKLVETVRSAGFAPTLRPGFYYDGPGIRRFLSRALNPLIARLGRRGVCLAPYYVIEGTKV